MTYRKHVFGASVTSGFYLAGLWSVYQVDTAYLQFTPVELVLYGLTMFAICVMFGIWPDVDTSSKAQVLFYAIFLVADFALIVARQFEAAAYFGLLAMLPVLSKHRGWIHSPYAMFLLPLPLLIVPWVAWPARPLVGLPFYGAAVIGYFSHLLLDGLIVPLPKRRQS